MAKASTSHDIKNCIKKEEHKTYSTFACRVCLHNIGAQPIFGDEQKPDISIEVITFGGIDLDQNDDYPKFICTYCFSLLESAVQFRSAAQHSQTILKRKKGDEINPPTPDTKDDKVKYDFSEEFTEYSDESSTDLDQPKIDFVSVKSDINIKDSISCNIEDLSKDDNDTEELILLKGSDDSKQTEKDCQRFACTYCNIQFETSVEFEKHRDTVDHKRNYVLSFLPKKKTETNPSNPPKKRKVPESKTINPKDLKCDICDRSFTKFHYRKHMRTKHKIIIESTRAANKKCPKKECPVCFRKLNAMALPRHMKKIHGDEKDLTPKIKLECPICKKLFSKDFFPLHLKRHKQGDAKNYVCDQCGKKFFFKSSFSTHRLIHTNDLPHKCEYCPYKGRTKELLKIHVRTHTGDYPYKCTQCSTRCLTKSNLNSHMRRHRGPIDFICDVCNRGFYSKIQLERHISVSHYGIKNHVCTICGAAFGYRHGLMSHQRKVHKRPKGVGKPKAVYLQLEEEGVLQPQGEV